MNWVAVHSGLGCQPLRGAGSELWPRCLSQAVLWELGCQLLRGAGVELGQRYLSQAALWVLGCQLLHGAGPEPWPRCLSQAVLWELSCQLLRGAGVELGQRYLSQAARDVQELKIHGELKTQTLRAAGVEPSGKCLWEAAHPELKTQPLQGAGVEPRRKCLALAARLELGSQPRRTYQVDNGQRSSPQVVLHGRRCSTLAAASRRHLGLESSPLRRDQHAHHCVRQQAGERLGAPAQQLRGRRGCGAAFHPLLPVWTASLAQPTPCLWPQEPRWPRPAPVREDCTFDMVRRHGIHV
jgi:hypothetical protein